MGGLHLGWAIARGPRLLLGLIILGGTAVTAEVSVASSAAFADTVIDGCTIVSNPTPTNYTDCVDMNLSGASLTNLNLSYADFEGSTLDTDSLSPIGGEAADFDGSNLTDANLTDTVDSGCVTLAELTSCNGVDFTDSALTGANFTDADFGSPSTGGSTFTGTLLVPSDVTVYSNTATDVSWPTPRSLPGATPGNCEYASGSVFPVGTTTNLCAVEDDSGGDGAGTFTVTVGLTAPGSLTCNLDSKLSFSPKITDSGGGATARIGGSLSECTTSPYEPGLSVQKGLMMGTLDDSGAGCSAFEAGDFSGSLTIRWRAVTTSGKKAKLVPTQVSTTGEQEATNDEGAIGWAIPGSEHTTTTSGSFSSVDPGGTAALLYSDLTASTFSTLCATHQHRAPGPAKGVKSMELDGTITIG
jgi:hypothetical protein